MDLGYLTLTVTRTAQVPGRTSTVSAEPLIYNSHHWYYHYYQGRCY